MLFFSRIVTSRLPNPSKKQLIPRTNDNAMEDGPCSEGVDYSGQFFKPKAGDVFRPGDKITAYWFGGKKGPDIQGLNFARTKRWSLTIQHLRFRQIATELGATKAVNMTIFCELRAPSAFPKRQTFEPGTDRLRSG